MIVSYGPSKNVTMGTGTPSHQPIKEDIAVENSVFIIIKMSMLDFLKQAALRGNCQGLANKANNRKKPRRCRHNRFYVTFFVGAVHGSQLSTAAPFCVGRMLCDLGHSSLAVVLFHVQCKTNKWFTFISPQKNAIYISFSSIQTKDTG